MPGRSKSLVQALKKIPVFEGLSPSQLQRLLSICQSRELAAGDVVCQSDTPSDEMYILLAGELAVTTAQGLTVAQVSPVTTVGEMGVITGQPRSATITAAIPSRILVMRKEAFALVLAQNMSLEARVMRNFITVLSGKVTNDNLRLREHEVKRRRFEGHLVNLEAQLRGETQRVEAALDFIDEKGIMPRDQAAEQVEAQMREIASRVLVVDDEPAFRELVRDALPYCAVLEAEDGQQALDLVEEEPPDLVVTDIVMPKVDGFELVQRLGETHPNLPVLAVSGNVAEAEVSNQGFSGFASKPFSVAEFRGMVDLALGDS